MTARAIIAGAGIAGVTTAIALARSGLHATVYERAEALEEFGAGLQLTPNATRVLSRLGVLDPVRRVAMTPRAVRILRGSDDALLLSLRLGDAERRWGAPYLALHRADLLAALVDAARRIPDIGIRCSAELRAFSTEGALVRAYLTDSIGISSDEGHMLIGADGLRSRVRNQLRPEPEDKPALTGNVAFRAAIDAAALDRRWREPEICVRLGPNAHLVHYPLRNGTMVNVVAVIEADWRGSDQSHPWDGVADRSALERAFAQWSPSTRKLLASAPQWRAWPLYRRPPLPDFAFGRVALVGDAAHPMEPFLAQGAAQAIEDAGALASSVQEFQDLPSALAAYSRRRRSRATRIQREASAQGRIYHMRGLAAVARDATMRLLGSDRLAARYDWIYGA